MKSILIFLTGALALAQANSVPHPYGTPVSLMWLSETENQTVTVNYTAIDQIFLHPEVLDRKIVSVSIIGAFRKGKSFMMDYCLRFMYANYKSVNFMNNSLSDKHDWIGSHEAPLTGFSWKAGPHRHTAGVVIWSDVFLIDNPNEKIAIVLLDTQGLFDAETTPADNSRIFALGTLISSEQIFNLKGVIQENQLEYLQMATEYAKFATNGSMETKNRPFQKLIFLLRDWENNIQYPYGESGGDDYVKEVLKVKSDQSPVLKNVRSYIKASFDSHSGFLMPHPGLKVVSDENFDGRFSRLDPNFQQHIKEFIDSLLGRYKLVKKKISGSEVTGKEFCSYVKTYFKAFQSHETPPIVSIYEATIESQLAILVGKAMETYKNKLNEFSDTSNPDFKQTLEELKLPAKGLAITWYKKQKKMGGEDHHKKFEKSLEEGIDQYYKSWKDNLIKTYDEIEKQKVKAKKEIEDIKRDNEEKLEKVRKTLEQQQKKRELEGKKLLEQVRNNMNLEAKEREAKIKELEDENRRNREDAEAKMKKLEEEQEVERARIEREGETRNRALEEELKALKFAQESRQKEIEARMIADQHERNELIRQAAMEKSVDDQKLLSERNRKIDTLLQQIKQSGSIISVGMAAFKEKMEAEVTILRTQIEDDARKIKSLTQISIEMQQEERRKSRAEFNENMRQIEAMKRRIG